MTEYILELDWNDERAQNLSIVDRSESESKNPPDVSKGF